MPKRRYEIEVRRIITFTHIKRVYADSEDEAHAKARDKVREGDWFGGDVTNDEMTSHTQKGQDDA